MEIGVSLPGKPDLRVFPDLKALSRAAAESVVALAEAAVRDKGRFTMALSGGSTPRALHRLLARDYRDSIPWPQVHIFWGDERFVPPDDSRSNYRMARKALLDRVPIPEQQIHPMLTLLPQPGQAADAYQATLRGSFPGQWPHLDLILLGLASDGHTASLFPNSSALEENERWVVAIRADVRPPLRLTLTFPAINHAANIHFLVAGKSKAPALRSALADNADPKLSPAAAIEPVDGKLVWWVDEAAGSL